MLPCALVKVFFEFLNAKVFIKKELEEKCSKERISEEEVIHFFLLYFNDDESLCFWC